MIWKIINEFHLCHSNRSGNRGGGRKLTDRKNAFRTVASCYGFEGIWEKFHYIPWLLVVFNFLVRIVCYEVSFLFFPCYSLFNCSRILKMAHIQNSLCCWTLSFSFVRLFFFFSLSFSPHLLFIQCKILKLLSK